VFIAPGRGGYYRAMVLVPDGRLLSAASRPVRLRAAPGPSHRVSRRRHRR
jgi:hypothetical protein